MKAVRAADLSVRQLEFLLLVYRMGPSSVGVLATAAGLSESSASRIVDRLQNKSFVERRTDRIDTRRTIIHITNAAAYFIELMVDAALSDVTQVVDTLSRDDAETFERAVVKFSSALEEIRV